MSTNFCDFEINVCEVCVYRTPNNSICVNVASERCAVLTDQEFNALDYMSKLQSFYPIQGGYDGTSRTFTQWGDAYAHIMRLHQNDYRIPFTVLEQISVLAGRPMVLKNDV